MRPTIRLFVIVTSLGALSALADKPVKKHEYEGVVNLNTATAQQLDLLPGVGAKAAKRIIDHRTKTPFAKPEDLRQVKGFGKKKFDKLKPYLAVSGATTLKEKKVVPKGDADGSSAQGRTPPPKR
jgi:competence protein ComEA